MSECDIRKQFIYTNDEFASRGYRYYQLFHHFPVLEPFYSKFEKNYDVEVILNPMKANNYVIPIVSVVLYMAFCYFGTIYMKDRKPFDLQEPLAFWNLLLALFSTYGMIRTVPHLLHRLFTVSFEETVCDPPYLAYGAGACGMAVQLFILSKIPELIDTVFIVLRKKPLIFLHWYHHVTVLLYCWNSYVTESAAGIYFASMNYTVHAAMYFYYYLQAAKLMPKWFPPMLITFMQITQMFIGTFIVGACFYYHKYGGKTYPPGQCNNTESNLIAGGIMYASYLYLFLEFFVKRFLFGVKEEGGGKKKSSKKVENEEEKDKTDKKVETEGEKDKTLKKEE